MNNCPNYKTYPRIYIQYNDLVFSGMSSVTSADLSGDFKISTTEYPFQSGSYYGGSFKNGDLVMSEQDLSLSLELPFIRLTRLQALDYHNYIMYNLSKPGRIWAIDTGGILIWAWAIPKHPPYTEYSSSNGKTLSMNMDFLLPEGIWYKANTYNVFLQDYSLCDFKDCFGTDCSHSCNAQKPNENTKARLWCDVTECMNWCHICWNPYDNCETPYRIIYNCNRGEEYYGTKTWGQEFMGDENCLSGNFCSNTIRTAKVQATLVGKYKNPKVTINDTTIQVMGTYDGRLVFTTDGKVLYYESDGCDDEELLMQLPEEIALDDIELITYQTTFTAHRGTNYFNVRSYEETENGSEFKFIYVKVDEITY